MWAGLAGALAGLTTRGRCFLAAGLATIFCGVLLGERDLLRVGLLLVALPLAAVLLVARARYRLRCTRSLEPPRVPAGVASQVVLRLDNMARLPTGVLLVEDQLPYSLGGRPRFVVDRLEPRGVREIGYQVRSEVRGRYRIGPLAVRLTDPFGLSECSRSFVSTDHLVVTPAVVGLAPVRLGGDWSGGGEAAARAISSAGEDDAATREYRQGDDLRKVHWRSTARTGALMVRREEQPRQNRAAVLLDTRFAAHRGDGPASSFEWAVSAAASLGVHLARAGYTVRLVTDDGAGTTSAAGSVATGALLDELAVIERSTGTTLSAGIGELRRSGDGVVVAVVGSLDAAEAERLARLRHGRTVCVAVLLDPTGAVAASARARADAATAYDAGSGLLAAAGWRVLAARPGVTLAELWPRAAARAGGGLVGAAR